MVPTPPTRRAHSIGVPGMSCWVNQAATAGPPLGRASQPRWMAWRNPGYPLISGLTTAYVKGWGSTVFGRLDQGDACIQRFHTKAFSEEKNQGGEEKEHFWGKKPIRAQIHTRTLIVFCLPSCNFPYFLSAQGQSLDGPPILLPQPSSLGLIHHKFQKTVKVLKSF